MQSTIVSRISITVLPIGRSIVISFLYSRNPMNHTTRLSALTDSITELTDKLEDAVMGLKDARDILEEASLVRDTVLPAMSELRIPCDQAEILTAKSYWPFPTYGDILFSVK